MQYFTVNSFKCSRFKELLIYYCSIKYWWQDQYIKTCFWNWFLMTTPNLCLSVDDIAGFETICLFLVITVRIYLAPVEGVTRQRFSRQILRQSLITFHFMAKTAHHLLPLHKFMTTNIKEIIRNIQGNYNWDPKAEDCVTGPRW